jgi:hypothetical protein
MFAAVFALPVFALQANVAEPQLPVDVRPS